MNDEPYEVPEKAVKDLAEIFRRGAADLVAGGTGGQAIADAKKLLEKFRDDERQKWEGE